MSETWNLRFEAEYKEPLSRLAQKQGFTWGDRGNVTEFLRAIARGDLSIGGVRAGFTPMQQKALLDTILKSALTDNFLVARELTELLHATEIETDIALALKKITTLISLEKVCEVEPLIKEQTAFKMSYQSLVTRNVHVFDVQYAEFAVHQGQFFLDCWATSSTKVNPEIEGLQDNWSFPLKHLESCVFQPNQSQWRKTGLNTVNVEFYLFSETAKRYELLKNEEDSWQDTTRIIITQTSFSTRLLKRLMRFAPDVRIAAPEPLAVNFKDTVQKWIKRFD